ncbi:hypothetical protein V8F33_010267 [Rhypophila sp. PSN 637]
MRRMGLSVAVAFYLFFFPFSPLLFSFHRHNSLLNRPDRHWKVAFTGMGFRRFMAFSFSNSVINPERFFPIQSSAFIDTSRMITSESKLSNTCYEYRVHVVSQVHIYVSLGE